MWDFLLYASRPLFFLLGNMSEILKINKHKTKGKDRYTACRNLFVKHGWTTVRLKGVMARHSTYFLFFTIHVQLSTASEREAFTDMTEE